jgi:hypothetical protein
LQNTGASNTRNLVATLLPVGGVINPGQAQNYGALAIGGAIVSPQAEISFRNWYELETTFLRNKL